MDNTQERRNEIYQLIAEGKKTSEIDALGKYDLTEIKSVKSEWLADENKRRIQHDGDVQQARMAKKNKNRPRRWNPFDNSEAVTSGPQTEAPTSTLSTETVTGAAT